MDGPLNDFIRIHLATSGRSRAKCPNSNFDKVRGGTSIEAERKASITENYYPKTEKECTQFEIPANLRARFNTKIGNEATFRFPNCFNTPSTMNRELMQHLMKLTPGDSFLIAEANFPAASFAKHLGIPTIDMSESSGCEVLLAVLQILPINIGSKPGEAPLYKVKTDEYVHRKKRDGVIYAATRALIRNRYEPYCVGDVCCFINYTQFIALSQKVKFIIITANMDNNSSVIVCAGTNKMG